MISRIQALALCTVLLFASSLTAQEQEKVSRYEVGTLYTFGPQSRIGLGSRFSFNFNRKFAFDSEWSTYRGQFFGGGFFSGNHMENAYFGIKAGVRKKQVGLFAKLRPGLTTNANSELTVDFAVPINGVSLGTVTFGNTTNPLLDFGAVGEVYLSKRWFIRCDLGDTVIFYGKGTTYLNFPIFPMATIPTFTIPGHTENNFKSSVGISYRF